MAGGKKNDVDVDAAVHVLTTEGHVLAPDDAGVASLSA
jgi:hypothetical protein